MRAVQRIARPAYKSTLEADYALALEAERRAGLVVWYAYEPLRLRLASGAWFTPDWLVQRAGGELAIDETKGWMREAARVRLLVAVERYPFFRWRKVTRERGLSFRREELTP